MKTWILAAGVYLGACAVVPDDTIQARRAPPGSAHDCVGACDHLVVDGGWRVVPKPHRHEPGCGHHWANGAWVKDGEDDAPTEKVDPKSVK